MGTEKPKNEGQRMGRMRGQRGSRKGIDVPKKGMGIEEEEANNAEMPMEWNCMGMEWIGPWGKKKKEVPMTRIWSRLEALFLDCGSWSG
jgi:hypothetical protein